jgi:hypothetical protein
MERNFELALEPPRFLDNKHLQTIFTTIFPPKNLLRTKYPSEVCIVKCNDRSGDFLWLDHSPPLVKKSKKEIPYLVLFHGMEGSADSHYIVSLAELALSKGYGVVRVNLRGCGRGEGLSKKGYHAGMTQDIKLVEDFTYKKFSKKVILCGFSLSANTLLKYLGTNSKSKAICFSAVSPPLDLKRACEYIDSSKGIFYRNVFLSSFKNKFKTGSIFSTKEQKEKAISVKTMFDYDDIITGPNFGFRGALDYYKFSSSIFSIYKIKKKGIIIHAEDDPLIPPDSFLSIDWKKIPSVTPLLTKSGGHVGFITKKTEEIPDGKWLNYVLLKYFERHTK